RVYWTAFDGSLSPFGAGLTRVLVGFGVATALVGAAMSFAQQHIKRLLAFSTVSHVGLFLVGLGVLDHVSLGGAAVYVLSHGPLEGRETIEARGRTPATMLAPAAVLLGAALALGVLPGLTRQAERGAARFEDRKAYAERVLSGVAAPQPSEAVEPAGTFRLL